MAGQRNPDDTRNKLVRSYIKILSQVKPKYFVMENVLGILSAKFTEYDGVDRAYNNELVVNVLLSEFKSIGYSNVEVKTLDASDFGVPQRRYRVIFLGTRDDVSVKVKHPEPLLTNKISASEAIDDLTDISYGESVFDYNKETNSAYQIESRTGRTKSVSSISMQGAMLMNHQTSIHNELVIERFSLLKEGETVRSLLNRLLPSKKNQLNTKKQNCKKIVRSIPSPTVLTLPDDLVHYSKSRILTVREMARLQSFDDSFEFLGKRTTGGSLRKHETPQYTLVGNAVPPLLAKAIAKEIMDALLELED